MALTEKQFESWLKDYGAAWEARDGATFSKLFEEDAIYYWTPFSDPMRGQDEIAETVGRITHGQKDIEFGARVLYTEANLGCAHWSCAFTREGNGNRVKTDGILVVQFGENGKALSFREWWHTDED